jgi:hypothetical protein
VKEGHVSFSTHSCNFGMEGVGTAVTNLYAIHEDINITLSFGNFGHHSVQNILPSNSSKGIKIKNIQNYNFTSCVI